MDLIPSDTDEIVIEEKKDVFSLDDVFGSNYDTVSVQSAAFDSGGLYAFLVVILAAENKELKTPLTFYVTIPFPATTFHDVEDPIFGTQKIRLVSYFDRTENFQYDSETRSISFFMPFEWSDENINRTSVVHEELAIPKTFGNLMLAKYDTFVNDVKLSDELTIIDEFWGDLRLVHVILSHNDLFELSDRQEGQKDGMMFLLQPSSENAPLSAITDNAEFRILIWNPNEILSGSKATISFSVYTTYPNAGLAEVSYDLSVSQDGKEIFSIASSS